MHQLQASDAETEHTLDDLMWFYAPLMAPRYNVISSDHEMTATVVTEKS